MTKTENIIANVNATMTMENMPLTEDDKQVLKRCLDGVDSFDDILASIVKSCTHKKVSV